MFLRAQAQVQRQAIMRRRRLEGRRAKSEAGDPRLASHPAVPVLEETTDCVQGRLCDVSVRVVLPQGLRERERRIHKLRGLGALGGGNRDAQQLARPPAELRPGGARAALPDDLREEVDDAPGEIRVLELVGLDHVLEDLESRLRGCGKGVGVGSMVAARDVGKRIRTVLRNGRKGEWGPAGESQCIAQQPTAAWERLCWESERDEVG